MRTPILAMLLALAAPAAADPLSDDEVVMFVPSTAHAKGDDKVDVRVEAWVYELENRPGATSTLARYLGVDLDTLSKLERDLFYKRTQLFRVDSERRKRVDVEFSPGVVETLPPTDAGGRAAESVELERGQVRWDAGFVTFSAHVPGWGTKRAEGRALLVPRAGLSVVSDIDDTIKDSNVLVKKELLLNTFARPFKAVAGMAERYRELEKAAPGTTFHYVSSSPVQLWPPLSEFLGSSGYPAGSVHLRESTSISNVYASHNVSRSHKLTAIRRLIADHDDRTFVLIGDSGEQDPEIYAEIARDHPKRVRAIFIRDVTNEDRDAPRYERTFERLPPALWTIFDTPPSFVPPPVED